MVKGATVAFVWAIWLVPCLLFPLALVVPILASVWIVTVGVTDEWKEEADRRP